MLFALPRRPRAGGAARPGSSAAPAPAVSQPAAAVSAPAPAPAAVTEPEGDIEEEMPANFGEVLAQSLESEPTQGEIIAGRIIRIDNDGVVVDVGYKSEGVIARDEFVNARGEFTAKIGDPVQVLIQRRENREGFMVLSKRLVDRQLAWDRVKASLAGNAGIDGQVVGACKGGFTVDLGGLQAFLPGSQLDLRAVAKPEELFGQTFHFKVIKINKERNNIVVSRRNLLLEEQNKKRAEAITHLAVGRLVKGTIKNITKFGAFVDLGGVDGLLRTEDMSWSRVSNPRQLVTVGDEIEALVLSVDETTGKVGLGLKQKSSDPWVNLTTKYPVGSLVQGEVVSLAEFGAFLRLEEGVEGLLPVSEMSWTKRVRHPEDVLKVGDTVRVMVLAADTAAKKVTLGLKQTEPEPFGVYFAQHKAGETVEGEVKTLTNFGAFVELAEGVTGLVHISDLSWDGSVRQPADVLQRGDKVRVKILEFLADKKKISLGLKQTQTDPWIAAAQKYPVGTVVRVKVLRSTKVGVFVQLEPGVEGLIHISQLEKKGNETPELPVDSVVEAKVIKASLTERKIGLSVRELASDLESEEVKKYLNDNRRGASLGELSGGDQLKNLLERMSGDSRA
ncbi:MAG: 30S ribosomal protein S1 [Candidatus Firestonebacteria bacterium]|nr:30S ribosomal protein S1 [Candidatus Firestonebacteria bacterium]